MTTAPISILVLDDHEVVRNGLITMLNDEEDMRVVAEARTGEDALPMYREHRPDVALVDLRLPGMSGVEFIATVKRERPEARFVVLTTFDSDEDIFQAFKTGAQAYVLKDSFRAEILQAVRAVHAGKNLVPKDIELRMKERRSASSLSPREIEVLQRVAQGESNKIIAAALGISEGTIKTHLINIYAKLGVSDRTAATTAAIQRGIIRI
jgi:two-component system, NarL family, response regulator